jgi:hypothetical protein
MNPITTSFLVVGFLGLFLGIGGSVGIVPLAVFNCSTCYVPGTNSGTVPGIPTCSGTNTICPNVVFLEKGYKLVGWINGTYALGVTIDNNPSAYDTSYVQFSPSTGKGCGTNGGTCLFSFNVSSIRQTGGAFYEAFSYTFPGGWTYPGTFPGSYNLNTQIIYTQTSLGVTSKVSLYTVPQPISIPGNQTFSNCGNSCFSLSAGFSFSLSGLFGAFNDTSAVTGGSVANATWSFGDGSTATGTRVTHVFTAVGQYRVSETVVAQNTGGVQQLFATTTLPVNITLSQVGPLIKGQTNPTTSGSLGFFHPSLVDGILIGASVALILAAWLPKHPVVILGAVAAGGTLGGLLL